MPKTQIIGIVLVKNEDVYVRQSITNIVEFCDRIIVADNQSADDTWRIVTDLSNRHPHIECYSIKSTGYSHDLIKKFAGTDTWVFGVDGDEIYDRARLSAFKSELLSGTYDDWWVIFGNVLNCVHLDSNRHIAKGYLSPPSRSITKLYNFKAITRWDGPCLERMLGGNPKYKEGFDAMLRLHLHDQYDWSTAPFRCLHTCFVRRSSRDWRWMTKGRPNPVEFNSGGILARIGLGFLRRRDSQTPANWKREKYMRGRLITTDVSEFFAQE